MIFRAFFAIPSTFSTREGLPTNATYGFALMFRKLLAGRTPAMGAVVFDAPGRTFRDERFSDYKAQRPPMLPEMRQQIPWIHRVVEAHDFPLLAVPGYEADDVIGTIATAAVAAGHEVVIASSDKDFAQLIGDHVRMMDTVKDVTYDAELVRKKWGVLPSSFVDYLALTGDTSDNIPGVPGIGPKTAKKLLEQFGDLDAVLAGTSELKGKQKENLEKYADDARLSRELATIDVAVPLDLGLDDLVLPEVDVGKVDALYRELEFFSLLSGDEAKARVQSADYAPYASVDEASTSLAAFASEGLPVAMVAMHTEPSATSGRLLGVAFSRAGEKARYLAVRGEGGDEAALPLLREFAENAAAPKLTHDLRDIVCLLLGEGITLRGVVGDTALASFLVDPTGDMPHGLDQVARRYLHRGLVPLKSVVGGGKNQRALADVPVAEVANHAGQLVSVVAEAWPLVAEAAADLDQGEVLRDVSMPLAFVLAKMQRDGIRADEAELKKMGVEFGKRKAEIETHIHALAGREFNVGSPQQLGEVLFDELELPVIKRTKTGYSTAADVLERLAPSHPIASEVLRWRALAKLINTYTRVLREAIDPRDGRIHCTFQQTVGVSGRLITTDPDLQRTPIRTEDGKRIRAAFIPRDGWVMVSADWSQIELRILAHFSQDPLLLESFREGIDVHRRTASQLFDVAPEEVDARQRNIGKTVNFATIYGQGAVALGQQLGLSKSEAKDIIERYFQAYAGVRAWVDQTVADAHRDLFVETLLGRRRQVPELASNNFTDRAYGERIAANTPIQGSGADICKLAMLEIARRLEAEKLEARMLLQIHDELVFECPPAERDALVALARDAMENAVKLSVPLVVDIGWGESWAEAH